MARRRAPVRRVGHFSASDMHGARLGNSGIGPDPENLSIGSEFRAPHPGRQPMMRQTNPTVGTADRAAAHAQAKTAQHHAGTHLRATVIAAANPATVQIHGSDTTVLVPLAQHVTVASLTPGGVVDVVMFGDDNPGGGLVVAAF